MVSAHGVGGAAARKQKSEYRARTAVVEASWSYRHPPRVGREKPVVAVTVITRALAGFVWAIGQAMRPTATGSVR